MRMKKQKKPAAREFHQFDSTMRKLLVAREMLPFASVRMLASIIGVSAPHVVRLLQEFRRGGFLREERASVVDPVRLGLKMEALVEVRCRQVHVDKLAREIEAQLPQLRRVWTVASEADLVASVMVRDSDHLLSTLKALEKSKSVERTKTSVTFSRIIDQRKVPFRTVPELADTWVWWEKEGSIKASEFDTKKAAASSNARRKKAGVKKKVAE